MTRILLAPDKFKGSLSAQDVAGALTQGLTEARCTADIATVPVADGGEGTLAALVSAGFRTIPLRVVGPTGQLVATSYVQRDSVAVVELADACGLLRLHEAPSSATAMLSSTYGVGQAISAALQSGLRQLIVGVGGSASTDGGAGLLSALDARILDSGGRPVHPCGAKLIDVTMVDITGPVSVLRGINLIVASDVQNPLTGPNGAAAIYGPQKGASSTDIVFLDTVLAQWADVVTRATGQDLSESPGAGAGGGAGFALLNLGAEFRPGIGVVLDSVGFDTYLADADLVITGEGSLDRQTLEGKALLGVASRARAAGVPVIAVCGRNALPSAATRSVGIKKVYVLSDLEPDVERCMLHTSELLQQIGMQIAVELAGEKDARG